MFKKMDETPVSYYIIFLTIYVISFVCIFKKNVELIGYGLLYAINIFATIFCVKDLYVKIPNEFPVLVGLIVTLALNIVSSSLFIVSIARIYKFSKDKPEMVLSRANKKKIHLYRDLLISALVSIWTILLYVFIAKIPSFNLNAILGNEFKLSMIEIIKFLLVAYPLAISGYLVYHANNLVIITRSLI
jgi:hypothetical protein